MAKPDFGRGLAFLYPLKNRALIFHVVYYHTYKWKYVHISLIVEEHLDAPEEAILKPLVHTCFASFVMAFFYEE